MTFELVDLEELGEKALHDFNLAVNQEGPTTADACERAVNSLVAKVEFTYAVAAKLADREQTVEGTASIWSKMVTICDDIALQMKRIEQRFPWNKPSYDRILDFRNAAERRRELHS